MKKSEKNFLAGEFDRKIGQKWVENRCDFGLLYLLNYLNDLEKVFGMAANRDLDDTFRGNCQKRHPGGVLP